MARSADGQAWGEAVASKFFSVGSVVPAARAGDGAVATQAWVNVAYKSEALAYLGEGVAASAALKRLLGGDDASDHRQVGIVDVDGGVCKPHRLEVPGMGGWSDRRRLRDPGQHP